MPLTSGEARGGVSARWRALAIGLLVISLGLGGALAGSWWWFRHLALTAPQTQAPRVEPPARVTPGPVTPLLLQYKLDLPGRGEIFPAMSAAARDYWPVAVLTVSNTAEKPALQVVSARVDGWSQTQQQTLVLGPGETRTLKLAPELLPRAYGNGEVRRAMLQVSVSGAERETTFAQTRPVLLHPGSDLYWGEKFANAQFVARWVTPHDSAVLQLISEARRYVPRGRLGGYNISPRAPASALPAQVKLQARAVYRALQRSGISYVSSIYTFGNYAGEAQRIRLPRETLGLRNANCIDVSVVFASAMENLGMEPMVVIVPGHAYVGVRLRPQSEEMLYLDLTVLPKGSFEQAVARAEAWKKKTPDDQVLAVDVMAARKLGIYPLPGELAGE